eukprot:185468-Chlamydomonas_euryale.AAC.1
MQVDWQACRWTGRPDQAGQTARPGKAGGRAGGQADRLDQEGMLQAGRLPGGDARTGRQVGRPCVQRQAVMQRRAGRQAGGSAIQPASSAVMQIGRRAESPAGSPLWQLVRQLKPSFKHHLLYMWCTSEVKGGSESESDSEPELESQSYRKRIQLGYACVKRSKSTLWASESESQSHSKRTQHGWQEGHRPKAGATLSNPKGGSPDIIATIARQVPRPALELFTGPLKSAQTGVCNTRQVCCDAVQGCCDAVQGCACARACACLQTMWKLLRPEKPVQRVKT